MTQVHSDSAAAKVWAIGGGERNAMYQAMATAAGTCDKNSTVNACMTEALVAAEGVAKAILAVQQAGAQCKAIR